MKGYFSAKIGRFRRMMSVFLGYSRRDGGYLIMEYNSVIFML
jgi:hypothetical protein